MHGKKLSLDHACGDPWRPSVGRTEKAKTTRSSPKENNQTWSMSESEPPRKKLNKVQLVQMVEPPVEVKLVTKFWKKPMVEEIKEPTYSLERPGTRPLYLYLKSKLKVIKETLTTDVFDGDERVIDSANGETSNDVPHEIFKTAKPWKPKAETSKLVTRPDGRLYQQIDHHTSMTRLYIPKKDGANDMKTHSYTGERVTEGVYDSGEKFVDKTPWFPAGAEQQWQKDRECRVMKERWEGKTFLALTLDNDDDEGPPSLNPREHHPPETEEELEIDDEVAVEVLIADQQRSSYNQPNDVSKCRPRKGTKPKILEICTSTMNMTTTAVKHGWHGCNPVTIETGYDLLLKKDRDRAEEYIKNELPDVIVAEWPCGPNSILQNINKARDPELAAKIEAEQAQLVPMISWIAKIEEWQNGHGKFFIAEQPSTCLSWKLPSLQAMQRRGFSTILDMCQFGLQDPYSKKPYRHRTKLVHNSHGLHLIMGKLCPGKHEHEITMQNTWYKDEFGKWTSIPRSHFAGWYTIKFCEAVLEGLLHDIYVKPDDRYVPKTTFLAEVTPRYCSEVYGLTRRLDGAKTVPCERRGCLEYFSTQASMRRHVQRDHAPLVATQPVPTPPPPAKRRKLTESGHSAAKENNQIVELDSTTLTNTGSSSSASPVPPEPRSDADVPSIIPPGYAPLMDLSRPYTNLEASGYGFASADDWKNRTIRAQQLEMSFIPLNPHERLVRVPPSEPGYGSAAEEPRAVPPEAAPSAAGQQTPITLTPGRRTLKPFRTTGKHLALKGQPQKGYAGGVRRAQQLIPQLKDMFGRVKSNTTPAGGSADISGTAASSMMDIVNGDPVPQGPPQAFGPTVTPTPRPPRVSEARADTRAPQRDRRAGDLAAYPPDFSAWLTCEDYSTQPRSDITFDETQLPPEARRVPEEHKRLVRNAHRNLGHPNNFALVRLMQTAKAPADLIAYARYMKCPTCARKQPPARIPRVTMPYRPTRFNHVVGLDVKEVKDSNGTRFHCLNILDLATAFNVFVPLADTSARSITHAFKWAWVNWAGTPEKIVCDQGRDFYGTFQEFCSQMGIKSRFIPTEGQWQNGMVERHGGVLGDIVTAVVLETAAAGMMQMRDVCLHASMCKNRRPGKTGYSPRSLVFGVDERLVLSGLNHYLEEPDDAAIANVNHDEGVKRSMAFRKSAMKAIIDLDHSTKWSDAIKFPSRPTEVQLFLPGHKVAFWRAGNTKKPRRAQMPSRWRLGIVIGHDWDEVHQLDAYWLSSGGRCFLVPGQHMRHVEMEEVMSHEHRMQEAHAALRNLELDPGKMKWYDLRQPLRAGEEEPPGNIYEGDLDALALAEAQGVAPQITYPDLSSDVMTEQQHVETSTEERRTRQRVLPRVHPHTSRVPAVRYSPSTPPGAPPSEYSEPLAEPSGPPTPLAPISGLEPRMDDLDDDLELPPVAEDELHSESRSVMGELDLLDGMPAEALNMRNQEVFHMRHSNSALVVDHDVNEVFILKWKTFKKNQKKGRELDPRAFEGKERQAFSASDAKEWKSFIDTGSVIVIPPSQAKLVPHDRIFKRSARFVRTNKDKSGYDRNLIAKSRLVVPGDVDPDGENAVEDGGFRTDAPTAPQLAFHLLMSYAVRRQWHLRTFDVSTAFLSGKAHNREIYMRPPPEGLPGVPPGSLLKIVKGAYGLREAPRLWYLKAREVLMECGFEELKTAKACFVLRDKTKTDNPLCGMLVLHVDDACYGGDGLYYKSVIDNVLKQFKIGNQKEKEFDFLGRHVKQNQQYFSIEIDQHQYVKNLERVFIPKARRCQPNAKLNPDELSSYRSIVGQLAWPARETMPQLSYAVSDLQQKTAVATVHDLCHANNVLSLAKGWAEKDDQKLRFKPFGGDAAIGCVWKDRKTRSKGQKNADRRTKIGLGAIHDASFMQQLNEGSQFGYCIMMAPVTLYDGPTVTHLLDWNSAKIHRKVRSTLAAEAAGASRAYDRACFARCVIYEIECGKDCHWTEMCRAVPFCLGTDCKSLYDVCTKLGSIPDERRVALDLLDVKEGVEELGDQVRWVPTDHMLADAFTKSMPPDLLLKYLKTGVYSFKYDEKIKDTKREVAKERK